MKHIYCFLLVIVIFLLICDNKLIETNENKYDTKQDRVTAYNPNIDSQKTLLDQLGLSDILPKEVVPDALKNKKSFVAGLNCAQYDVTDCASSAGLKPHDSDFHFGSDAGPSCGRDCGAARSRKIKCMNCLKCRDNYAFVDEYYSRMCDTFSGCYGNVASSINQPLPFVYAYDYTDWGRACRNKDSLNELQKLTCKALDDNTVLDSLTILAQPDLGLCKANIETLSSPVGSVASWVEN